MKYILICVIALMPVALLQAQDVKKFDVNGDSKLQDPELRAVYLAHVTKAKFSDYIDASGVFNNEMIDAEVALYKQVLLGRKKTGEALEVLVSDVEKDLRLNGGLIARLKILVRASHEDVTIMEPAKGFDKAEAAVVSLTKNYLSDGYAFTAKGAILRPISLHDEDDYTDQIVPSVTFNRVSDEKDSTKEANTLVGRVGYNIVIEGGQKVGAIFIKMFGSYATDFDFKSETWAAELEGEIAWNEIGIGTYQNIGFLDYRFNVIPHGEYGVTTDKGDKEKLVEDDPFLRFGARGNITLRPTFLKRLELTTSYTWLHGADGSPERFENFSQKANYALDEKKRFSLSLEYAKGKLPLTLDDVDNLIFGVSIKI